MSWLLKCLVQDLFIIILYKLKINNFLKICHDEIIGNNTSFIF